MTVDNVIVCRDCGKSDRKSRCINGNRFHSFIRTQNPNHEAELKRIWEKRS